MMLLCHPRSGSNWFLSCLVDKPYSPIEIFTTGYGSPGYLFKTISVTAKLSMVRNDKNKFFKTHFCDIERMPSSYEKEVLIDGLQKMEMYLLTRNDVKRSIVSFAIALHNNWNFLNNHDQLQRTFRLTEEQILFYYDLLYASIDRLQGLFNFKEQFVYEDLINGVQQPASFKWDKNKSTLTERKSMNYLHLIENWDQVEGWIDQLPQRN